MVEFGIFRGTVADVLACQHEVLGFGMPIDSLETGKQHSTIVL